LHDTVNADACGEHGGRGVWEKLQPCGGHWFWRCKAIGESLADRHRAAGVVQHTVVGNDGSCVPGGDDNMRYTPSTGDPVRHVIIACKDDRFVVNASGVVPVQRSYGGDACNVTYGGLPHFLGGEQCDWGGGASLRHLR
jgi:hypothetical protein